MTSVSLCGEGRDLPCFFSRTLSGAFRRAAFGAGVAAALACLPGTQAAAEPAACTSTQIAMATPKPVEADSVLDWTYAQFRGVGCERCDNRTQYCVVNFVRWEYVCAPRGNTIACAGSQGTRWCRAGQTCWDGVCR